MKSCFYFILLFPFVIISCAQKVNQERNSYDSIYASTSNGKNMYFPCNAFRDNTFSGSIWNGEESCIYLDINKSPKDLLRDEDLFLQIYPFSIKDNEINYGTSLPINTIKKTVENKVKEVLMESKMIDTYIVETMLRLDPDNFFLDHFFKICDVTETKEKWDGLQLVIYQRRTRQKPAPIRVTKLLLPPFLIHPEHFREKEGEALAAHHPLLDLIPEMKSQPSSYYDRAKEMCHHIF